VGRTDEQSGVRPLAPDGAPAPTQSQHTRTGLVFAIGAMSVVLLPVLVVFGDGGDQEVPDDPEPNLVAANAEELAVHL